MAVADVARFAVASVGASAADGHALPIGGPEALTPRDAMRLCEKVTGRRFQVRVIPTPVLRVLRFLLGPVAPIPASLITLALGVADRGDAVDMTETLRILPLPLTGLAEYVSAQVAREPARSA